MMNTTFKTLIENYPTYEALSAWLRSPEGGSLVIRDEHLTPEHPLVIIHYLKGRSDLTRQHVPAFRSVVWNIRTNRPVCVAPARGLRFSDAVDSGLAPGSFITEDFVDGVMVSMFHDGATWRLATRTQLDAGSHFYGKRPFAELFTETLAAAGLTLESFTRTDLQYSWVLQHPEERIVVAAPYGIPQLRLVELSQVAPEDGAVSLITDRNEQRSVVAEKLLPAVHELRTLEEVKERVVAWGRRFGAGWQGVCLKEAATGRRWKLRSDQYDEARHLRGNQAKRQFLWLERWSEGRLPAYLKIYPEEACAAEELVARFKACTTEFHAEYLRVYKERACRLGEVTPKWRKLLWEARQVGVSSYFAALRDFLNGQDTARKLWLVNFEERYGATPAVPAEVETEVAAS
jgi:hypothetical protein